MAGGLLLRLTMHLGEGRPGRSLARTRLLLGLLARVFELALPVLGSINILSSECCLCQPDHLRRRDDAEGILARGFAGRRHARRLCVALSRSQGVCRELRASCCCWRIGKNTSGRGGRRQLPTILLLLQRASQLLVAAGLFLPCCILSHLLLPQPQPSVASIAPPPPVHLVHVAGLKGQCHSPQHPG